MANILAQAQETAIDITDAYSVFMSSESHTFAGDKDSALAGSTSTQIKAYLGNEAMKVQIGTITCPTGMTSSVTGNGTTTATVTFTVTDALTAAGTVSVPVTIVDKGVTINKEFGWAIAFEGADGTSIKITSTEVKYVSSSDGTSAPADTASWSASVPEVAEGDYLWTRTIVNYSDGTQTKSYSATRNGVSVEVASTEITYQKGTSGTTAPTGTWSATVPETSAGEWLWTKTVVTYTDGKQAVSTVPSRNGSDGQDGADAITCNFTSDNGTVFRNSEGETTFTAHVYQGGAELTSAEIAALGTLNWYVDGTKVGTGATYTLGADDFDSKAVVTLQLEA